MKETLRSLLEEMEAVGNSQEELYDTDVREQMAEAISRGFVHLEPGYTLPLKFGMFSDKGNAEVRSALATFLTKAPGAARVEGLDTPAKRLAAFQDQSVLTSGEGQAYDTFFGHVGNP
jgi:hypothetical protein